METYNTQMPTANPELVSNNRKNQIRGLYVLSIFLYLGFGFMWSVNCAWGGCPSALNPVPMFGIGMLVLLLIRFAYKNIVVSFLYWTLFTLSLAIMVGLLVVDELPPSVRNNYVYGLTLAACESGKPSVPWGNVPTDKNECYESVGECSKMTKYSPSCFDFISSKAKLTSPDQCSNYTDGKENCLYDIAVKMSNIDFCRTMNIIDSEGVAQEGVRYSCAEEVTSISEFIPESGGLARKNFRELLYPYAHSKAVQESAEGTLEYRTATVKYGVEFCNNTYIGNKRDVCLYQVKIRSHDREESNYVCDLMSLDWFKESCRRFE